MAAAKDSKPQVQDPETKIVEGAVPTVPGEISPAADQSNRDSEIAARMAVTPVRTLQPKVEETKEIPVTEIEDEEGVTVFIDPDELEEKQKVEALPQDVCINCRNQGRGEVELDHKGFCSKCGFKLNRLHNMALVPSPVPVK